MPSSNFAVTDCSTQSTQRARRREVLGHRLDRVARELQEGLAGSGASPSGRARAAAAARRPPPAAKATAAASTSPSTRRSISCCPGSAASVSLCTGSPETIMFSAVSSPSTRGRRCVPPAPGTQADLDFGQRDRGALDRDAVVAAERELQPTAHAHAVDRGDHRLGRARRAGGSASAGCGSAVALGEPNSLMSAPPENALPAPVITMALTAASACARSTASAKAAPRRVAQAVDGRVVQGDDGHRAVHRVSWRS